MNDFFLNIISTSGDIRNVPHDRYYFSRSVRVRGVFTSRLTSNQ